MVTKVAGTETLYLATMQSHICQYWKRIKENRELTFRGKGNNKDQNGQLGQGGPGGQNWPKHSADQKRKTKGKKDKSDNSVNTNTVASLVAGSEDKKGKEIFFFAEEWRSICPRMVHK